MRSPVLLRLFTPAAAYQGQCPSPRVGLNRVTVSGATGVITSAKELVTRKGSRGLYLGVVGTFVFTPKMLGIIKDITGDRLQGNSTSDMRRWLKVHYVRLAVADLPAWFAYMAAVLTTVSL